MKYASHSNKTTKPGFDQNRRVRKKTPLDGDDGRTCRSELVRIFGPNSGAIDQTNKNLDQFGLSVRYDRPWRWLRLGNDNSLIWVSQSPHIYNKYNYIFDLLVAPPRFSTDWKYWQIISSSVTPVFTYRNSDLCSKFWNPCFWPLRVSHSDLKLWMKVISLLDERIVSHSPEGFIERI